MRPELVTLAKGLANGLPIGCLLVADEAAGAFVPGDHGSTFGGNPVVCAAALAVVRRRSTTSCSRTCARTARGSLDGLGGLPHVVEVRGAGLLVGCELDVPAQPVVDAALDAGLVCLTVGRERLCASRRRSSSAPTRSTSALAILTEVLNA